MMHVISLLLVLVTGLIPTAAATQVLNNGNAEYLALLGQKGTQIIRDGKSRRRGIAPDSLPA